LHNYSCTSQQNIKRIVLKQKEAIRVIANANCREHTPPLFKNLKILPLEKMIELSKLKFMHSCLIAYHFPLPKLGLPTAKDDAATYRC
jgi:hypothetical protein